MGDARSGGKILPYAFVLIGSLCLWGSIFAKYAYKVHVSNVNPGFYISVFGFLIIQIGLYISRNGKTVGITSKFNKDGTKRSYALGRVGFLVMIVSLIAGAYAFFTTSTLYVGFGILSSSFLLYLISILLYALAIAKYNKANM